MIWIDTGYALGSKVMKLHRIFLQREASQCKRPRSTPCTLFTGGLCGVEGIAAHELVERKETAFQVKFIRRYCETCPVNIGVVQGLLAQVEIELTSRYVIPVASASFAGADRTSP